MVADKDLVTSEKGIERVMSDLDNLIARVSALESTQTSTTTTITTNQNELNTFYLMWAGSSSSEPARR